jgi:hypothetical protein
VIEEKSAIIKDPAKAQEQKLKKDEKKTETQILTELNETNLEKIEISETDRKYYGLPET